MKMKLRAQTLSLLIVAVLGLFVAGCKDGGGETPKAKIELGKLSKTWSIVSVTLDNEATNLATDADPVFNNMTLTISGTYTNPTALYNYEVGGTMPQPSPWPKPGQTEGKWKFESAEGGLITRDPTVADLCFDRLRDCGVPAQLARDLLGEIGVVALARPWEPDLDLVGNGSDPVHALGGRNRGQLLRVRRNVSRERDRAILRADTDVRGVHHRIPLELSNNSILEILVVHERLLPLVRNAAAAPSPVVLPATRRPTGRAAAGRAKARPKPV